MVRRHFLLRALLVVGVTFGAIETGNALGYGAEKHDPFIGVRTTNLTPIRLQIRRYEYEIPANYFDVQPRTNCNEGSALLVALLPNFEGRSKENDKSFQQVGQERRRTPILIDAENRWHDGQTALESALYNRLHYNDLSTSRESISHQLRDKKHGLAYYWPIPGIGSVRKDDIFVQRGEHERLQSFISCSFPGSVPSPGCQHFFSYNDARIQISYPRSLLPKWHVIEANARRFVESLSKRRIPEGEVLSNCPKP